MMTPMPLGTIVTMLVFLALIAIPAAIVLKRIGRSPWWALLCFVPIAAMLGLWVLALGPWVLRRA